MSTYSEELFTNKLLHLVDTQDSISLLSHWLMFHRKHARTSVQVWLNELMKATASKQLSMLYLCNDVVQLSRRKHDDFVKEFGRVLPEGIRYIYRHATSDVQNKIRRILAIWEERGVYEPQFVAKLMEGMVKKGAGNALQPNVVLPPKRSMSSESPSTSSKHSEVLLTALDRVKKAHSKRVQTEKAANEAHKVLDAANPNAPAEKIAEAVNAQSGCKDALEAEIAERERTLKELKNLLATHEQALNATKTAHQECVTKLESLSTLSINALAAAKADFKPATPPLLPPATSGGMLQALLSNAAAAAGTNMEEVEPPGTGKMDFGGKMMHEMEGVGGNFMPWMQPAPQYPWNQPSEN